MNSYQVKYHLPDVREWGGSLKAMAARYGNKTINYSHFSSLRFDKSGVTQTYYNPDGSVSRVEQVMIMGVWEEPWL